jgi:hypothetical protein
MAKWSDKHLPKREVPKASKQITLRFRWNDEVGQIAAEHDKFLDEAFVDAGFYDTLQATDNPRSIVVGRTGAGKSALLLRLERSKEYVQRIDPLSVAIEYAQTTDIPALASAKLPKFDRGLWHPYRRAWASSRKHLPDVDVAKGGGWRDLATMKQSYQQADGATTLKAIENEPASHQTVTATQRSVDGTTSYPVAQISQFDSTIPRAGRASA